MRIRIPERDLLALAAVGRFRMLTRPQLKRWFFAEVSEPVVTRFLKRAEEAGYLGVDRMGGNGVQLVWLTRKGRDLLVARGIPATDLFPATGPVASKDFAHTVAIGDAAAWLAQRDPPPDELLPAWAFQRYFMGKLGVVPDILALWRPNADTPGAALAVEVDLGTEPLESVFLPKLRTLGETLSGWFAEATTRILVLVPTRRRADSLRAATAELATPLLVHTFEETTAKGVNSDVKSS